MKKTILLIAVLANFTLASAQSRHEVSANFGAGYSSLKYNINNSGDISSDLGVLFGVGYTYKFNSKWGIISGLEWASYKSEINFIKLNDYYMTQDDYGNDFEWRLALDDLKEKQEGVYLNIPVKLQFIPDRVGKFYANLGFIVGIPLSGKFDAIYRNLVASGYYPETDAEYTDIDFRGFGKFKGKTSKDNLDFGVAFMLSVECGMKWNLSNSLNLYAGGYIDYGLNNILKGSVYNNLIPYDKLNPTHLQYNGLLSSRHGDEADAKPFVDKIVPRSFGLRVKLGFSFIRDMRL